MSAQSKIEWTDATWNPTRGCTKRGPECNNCYAMEIAHRFSGPGQPFEGLTRVIDGRGQWNGKVRLVPEALLLPISWVKPRMIFVDSMSDLFHPAVPFDFIAKVFAVMACTTRHTYQILTKNPDRMLQFFEWLDEHQVDEGFEPCAFDSDGWGFPEAIQPSEVFEAWTPYVPGKRGGYDNCGPLWPLQNVWLGVSIGTRKAMHEYLPLLRKVPAVVRFISAEPLLEDLGEIDLAGIHWLIAGGESGRRARPTHPDWIRSLRDRCAAAGVMFFFKQWGHWLPHCSWPTTATPVGPIPTPPRKNWMVLCRDGSTDISDGYFPEEKHGLYAIAPVGAKNAGRLLDGIEHNAFPIPGHKSI